MSNRNAGRKERKWTPGKLFWRRLFRFWKEQWAVWRTALDWTVWVYILLPALWIGGGLYLELWQTQPAWMKSLPLWVGERLPLILILRGQLRTFAEEADVLFLLQKPQWRGGIIRRGALYTLLTNGIAAALLFVLLLPFLVVVHHMPYEQIAGLFLIAWVWSAMGAVIRNLIDGLYRGWRKAMWKTIAMAILAATYLLLVIKLEAHLLRTASIVCLALIMLAILMRIKLRAHETFEADVEIEKNVRVASTQLLLRDVMERKPRIKLNKPIVLRRSNRIFKRFEPDYVLAEQTIKAFIRRMPLVRMWLGFFGVSTLALLLSPLWVKGLLLAVLPLLIARWIQSHCNQFTSEAFVAQFNWTDQTLRIADERTRFWLIVPGVVWLGLVAGVFHFGVWGLAGAAVSGLYWWGVNKVMSDVLQLKERKKSKVVKT
ncbi:ABC transporter permease [Paenibacillus sp. GCM10027626]|uniref:ABC transporter permease n=1 Tax=Paenibacillus sp. GCM10027626 TaxID=3273411 RepID=UPI003640DD40